MSLDESSPKESLTEAMKSASLEMTKLGAKVLQFNQKETAINILLDLQENTDLDQIASVISTIESTLIDSGVSTVKLYHLLEGKDKPKCFRSIELKQTSLSPDKNNSEEISQKPVKKPSYLISIDAASKQNERKQRAYRKASLLLSPVIIVIFAIFPTAVDISKNHLKVIPKSTQLVEELDQNIPDTAQLAQLEINNLNVIKSELGRIEDNIPFNGYEKAQGLIAAIDKLIETRQNVLAPEIYKQASEKASQASQLTKHQRSFIDIERSNNAIRLWDEAIDSLRSINQSSELYASANEKIEQYSQSRRVVFDAVEREKQRTAASKPAATPSSTYLATKSTGISMTSYHRISSGMSYAEVRGIIGESGEELSRVDIEGIPMTVMYMWSNSDGSNMNVTFQGNKVVQKAQFGLK